MNNKSKTALLLLVITISIISIWLLLKKGDVQWTSENSLVLSELFITTDTGNLKDLLNSIDQSLIYYTKIDPGTKFSFGSKWCSAADMRACLEDFRENLIRLGLSEQFFKYVNENYSFYRTASKKLLLTGYFEASLAGAREKSETFKYPVYGRPDDLVNIMLSEFPVFSKVKGLPLVLRGRLKEDNRIVPYYSREEIDEQMVLGNRGLELLWVNDNIGLFFLHIQGSAVIKLSDTEDIRINYADTNGHPYRAIGRLLVERGICEYEDLSMQFIEKYLRKHPSEITDIFNYNPSYIFFREVEEGPVGSLGVKVTRYRSIASDKYIFPRGALCFLKATLPEFNGNGERTGEKIFHNFVLNQDTGGAIRTPGRADLFTGNGKKSEQVAGHLKEKGELYFLIKKELLKDGMARN